MSLSIEQQNAIHRMEKAIVNIDLLRMAINKTAREHGIECRSLCLPELPLLAHQLEGVLFDASCLVYQDEPERAAA